MKRTIVIEILLFVSFVVLLTFVCLEFRSLHFQLQMMREYTEHGNIHSELARMIPQTAVLGTVSLLATLADLAAMVLIALRDIPKLKAWIEQRKAARKVAKAEKAEADKQARIAALQAELDQLKKDE